MPVPANNRYLAALSSLLRCLRCGFTERRVGRRWRTWRTREGREVEMADADPQFKRLLLPAEETLFEQLLRFGLYVGAMFQIMCLLAIVVYQAGPSDGVAALKDDPSDVECSENSPQVTPRRPHRPRKQEKKKRR
ncbi:protein anon-73B1 isoform X1 [Temnothorax nylanderi]